MRVRAHAEFDVVFSLAFGSVYLLCRLTCPKLYMPRLD
jgi:hypothetical protein